MSSSLRLPPGKSGFFLLTGLPASLAFLYLLLFAQPTFLTEARLIVRENADRAAALAPGLASSLLGGGVKSSLEDAYILADHLHGASFIEELDARLNLRAHYRAPRLDVLRRLSASAPAEDFHDFYRRHVKITVNPIPGILTFEVSAFDPTFAQTLALALVEASERAINDLNLRMVAAQTALADQELALTREQLAAARRQLLDFQVSRNLVDPATEIGARLANLARLDSLLLQKRAELGAKRQFLREDAVDLRLLTQEVAALQAERDRENQLLVNPSDESMTATAQAYEEIKLEAEFALHAFTAALALNEKAKLDAARQEKFLLPVSAPHLPEAPVFPRPFVGAALTFLVLAVLHAIASLILATIRDHSL